MAIYGLLGRTLGHSWSPPIHAAFGCPTYGLLPTEPEALNGFFATADIGGLNVTIPYKQTVMTLCDHLDPLAVDIGAVNTIVRRDGKLYGYNTDAPGFMYIAKLAGISFAGKKVVVLGAGGGSLMVQVMVKRAGAKEVVVISRKGQDNFDNLERHGDAQIVVNATPVGQYPHAGVAPVDLQAFPHCGGVLDLVYNPQRTALLLQADKLGLPCCDGLPMLVAQAHAAEQLFFGKPIGESKIEDITNQLRHQMTNIVLVGMPGCGKTTVGEALATLIERPLVDLDANIAQTAGCSIPEIFAAQGEAGFRDIERQETALAGQKAGQILVTGGGVVKDVRNHHALRQNGRVYHLLRDVDTLPRDGRPISQTADLQAMWQEREPLYTQVRHVAIDNNTTPEAVANLIWRDFCAYFGYERP